MHLVAQAPRDQRTVQAVLERHADAEIRRQRESGDDLNGSDLLPLT
jgi:hypothetical protein